MNAKQKYSIHLFVNGRQVGDDSTFGEWAESDEQLKAEQTEYFEGEGYTVESIEITHPHWTEQWKGTPWEKKIADGTFTSNQEYRNIAVVRVSKKVAA
jgi:hypothetical protein